MRQQHMCNWKIFWQNFWAKIGPKGTEKWTSGIKLVLAFNCRFCDGKIELFLLEAFEVGFRFLWRLAKSNANNWQIKYSKLHGRVCTWVFHITYLHILHLRGQWNRISCSLFSRCVSLSFHSIVSTVSNIAQCKNAFRKVIVRGGLIGSETRFE